MQPGRTRQERSGVLYAGHNNETLNKGCKMSNEKINWREEKPDEAGRYLYRFDEESPVFMLHLYSCWEDNYCGLRALSLDDANKVDDMVGEFSQRLGNVKNII